MKVAAIIITYYPDLDLLRNNIQAIENHVETILIWRNSPTNLYTLLQVFPTLVFLGEGVNDFIAKPLNQAIRYCTENGYDYLLTLDQDSVFDSFPAFRNVCESDKEQDRTAIYAPFFAEDTRLDRSSSVLYVDEVITSGSLVNLSIAKRLNGFREDYEIDSVDFEYCCWARYNGYRIKVFPNYELRHKLGYFSTTKWGFRSYNYAPVRYFHIIRNMAWLHREYAPRENVSLKYDWKAILAEWYGCTRGVLLSEKKKASKLAALNSGLLVGCFGRIPQRRPTPLIMDQSADIQC